MYLTGNKYADDGNVEHDKIRWALYELDQSTVDKPGRPCYVL
jgi:hypothetical protein